MHHLDVSEEVKRRANRPRRRAVLRPIGGRIAAELELQRGITRILAEGLVLARGPGMEIAGELKRQLAVTDDATLRFGWFSDRLRDFLADRVDSLATILRRIFGAEETRHRVAFSSAIKAATGGIDISPVLNATDVRPHIDAAMLRSANLVRGITDQFAQRLAQDVMRAASQGTRAADLAKDLTANYEWGRKRAKLIARDQIAELNGQLNKVRQQQVGVEKYQWSTSLDERVRPTHQVLEGQTFSWSEPGPDDGNHPGMAINCRCVARAVIEF